MTKTLTYPIELVKQLSARHDELLARINNPVDLSKDELLEAIEGQEAVLHLLGRIGRITS